MGLFLFVGFLVIGVYDLAWPGVVIPADLVFRYGLVLPYAIGFYILSFRCGFERYMQAGQFLMLLLYGADIVLYRALYPSSASMNLPSWITLESGASFQLSMLLLVGYTLFRLRFPYVVLVSWILIPAYEFGGLYANHWQQPVNLAVTLHLLGANLIGMFAGYLTERSIRENFLLSREVEGERQKSEALLLNILPVSVADRLKNDSAGVADSYAEVTVMFADIVGFTELSAHLAAEDVVTLLNDVFSAFDRHAEELELEKIKTIGDAYMVVGGLPNTRQDHAAAVAEMALAIQAEMRRLSVDKRLPLHVRIGINTGPVVAGVIGIRKFIYDLWGDTVNMASRMESHGVKDGIQVTEATYEHLKERFTFEMRGEIPIKGRGAVMVYLLAGGPDRGENGVPQDQ